MAEDKGYKPTPRKLRDARRKGKLLKSKDLIASLSTSVVFIGTYHIIKVFWIRSEMLIHYLWTGSAGDPYLSLRICFDFFVAALVLLLSLTALCSILIEILQTGLHFEWIHLTPKVERFNFARGLQQIFSRLKEAWHPLLRLVLFFLVFIWFFHSNWTSFLVQIVSSQSSSLAEESLWELLCMSAIMLVLWGSADYGLKRRSFFKELSMSFDELKREIKDQEGDPQIKSARLAEHQSFLQQDIVARVRKSKVIIVERNND